MSKKKRRKPPSRPPARSPRSGAPGSRATPPSPGGAAGSSARARSAPTSPTAPESAGAPAPASPGRARSASAAARRSASQPAAAVEATPAAPAGAAGERGWLLGLAVVTLLAAVLRLVAVGRVPGTPFDDAAVRSMAGSWHNFFYGAFDPGASTSIGKPPLDLWAQVLAVKLFGFHPTALRLPGALAATAAVALLYDLVRRLAGPIPAIASAATLAVMPVAVLAARSDATDSLMMGLLVGAAWLLVRYAEGRQLRWLLLAAVVLGLDFNVKLFEALIPLPAFVVFLWMSSHAERAGPASRRLAAAAAVFVAVSLCWLAAVSLTPHADRPYALGSTDGSVWTAVFSGHGGSGLTPTTTSGPTQPATSPSAGPLRLFHRSTGDFGGLVGMVVFAGLVLGVLALLGSSTRLVRPPPDAPREERIRRAAVAGLGVWVVTGIVVMSCSGRIQLRDAEAFTPALAVLLGLSVSVIAGRIRDLTSFYLLAACLGLALLESLAAVGSDSLARAGLGVGLVAGLAGCVLLQRVLRSGGSVGVPGGATSEPGAGRSPFGPAGIVAFTMVALLAMPIARDIDLARDHTAVAPAAPEFIPRLAASLSDYLSAHRAGTRYAFAATAPNVAAPLIAREPQPILLLTTVDARPLVTLDRLRAAIAAREVSYVVVGGTCPGQPDAGLPACSAAAIWVRANGHDVTAELGDPAVRTGVLFRVG